MHQLRISNDLIGNRGALEAAWDRDGYWLFRDVLDHGAIARLRDVYGSELAKLGLIDPADPRVRLQNSNVERLPTKLEALSERRPYRLLTEEPAIRRFFGRLLGDEPFWIPIVAYQATPPTHDRSRGRLTYVHQDGFYNDGIAFRICWIPLVPIDESVGGIVVAAGLHKGPYLHDLSNPPLFPVPEGAVPADAWCRSTYLPGDLLMFDLKLPHTGLSNHSDRFRLSMDIRVMGASEDIPAIGPVTAINASSISVRCAEGREATFALDEATYCRGNDGKKTAPAEFSRSLRVGDEIIIAGRNGRATLVRTPN